MQIAHETRQISGKGFRIRVVRVFRGLQVYLSRSSCALRSAVQAIRPAQYAVAETVLGATLQRPVCAQAISFVKRGQLGGKKTEATEPLSPPPNNGDK